jgi:hypothetical protein
MGERLPRGEKAPRTRRAIFDLLTEHQRDGALPTNGRFVFYELEQRGLAMKPSPSDSRPNRRRSHGWPPGQQDIGDALTWLREQGAIPWSWIVDESRSISVWSYADSVRGFLTDRLDDGFRLNPWGDEGPPVIICESDATAGVLERVAAEYVVPITGTRGHANGFLRTEVAPVATGRRVLYLGDLDFSDGHIESNIKVVLLDAGWTSPDGDGVEMKEYVREGMRRWRRIAMTKALADEFGIEPILKTDGRTRRIYEAIEVESLGQARLEALVRRVLDELLPEPLADVQEREDAEAEAARGRIARWRI